jgi:hypothetical protein
MVDLDHNAWHVPTEGRPQLIVIAVRDCRLCAKTLVALDAFSREHAGTMSTAFVYGGSAAALVELATRQSVPIDGTLRFVSDPRGAIQQATRVTHTPYAFMIDADGTIVRSGLASEQRHLLWLAEALREPRTTNHKVMATA